MRSFVILIIASIFCLKIITHFGRKPSVAKAEPFEAVGSSSFYKLIAEDGVFVDKSLLIEEYLRRWRNKILITRPRQWGKSVNIDMLRRYLEIELDEAGEPLTEDKKIYRKLFLGGEIDRSPSTIGSANINGTTSNKKKLEPLKICKFEFIAKRQGEFPVIFLSLTNLTGSDYRQFEENVRAYVGDLFRAYRYVRESQTDDDKTLYDMLAAGGPNVTVDLLRKSVETLSRMVERRFNRKVHVLVDDYDAPLRNTLDDFVRRDHSSESVDEKVLADVLFKSIDYQKVVRLLATVLGNALNFNSALEMAFLTGNFPLVETPLARNLDSISDYSLTKRPFVEYYGFSQTEVRELLLKLSAKNMYRSIKLWYKGYYMSETAMYNPFSLMSALKNRRCDDYWVKAGEDGPDLAMANNWLGRYYVQAKLETLLAIRAMEIPTRNVTIGFNYLVHDDIFRFLLMTGYLTPGPPRKDKSSSAIVLRIPNYELKTKFVDEVLKFTRREYNLTMDDVRNGTKLLYKGFVEEFKTWISANFL